MHHIVLLGNLNKDMCIQRHTVYWTGKPIQGMPSGQQSVYIVI